MHNWQRQNSHGKLRKHGMRQGWQHSKFLLRSRALVSSFVIQWSDLDAVVRVDQIRSQRPAGFSTLADFQQTDSTFADSRRL
jgi:hypothetical protein